MVRFIEGTIILCIVILLFLGTVIYVVPKLVDLNDYKEEISTLVKEKTGRELVIEGDIELSLFPWVGADIGKVRMNNPEGFGQAPFVEVEQVGVAVKLMPLLSKEVEVETISIKGLNLNLMKDATGKTNWDDLIALKTPETSQPGEKPTSRDSSVPPAALPLAAFTAGGVIVENSNLTWQDNSSGLTASLQNISLKTGVITLGKPVDIALSFEMQSNKPDVKGKISLETQISLNDDLSLHKLVNTHVQSNLTWQDNSSGLTASLQNVDFKAGPIVLGQPVDIDLAFYLESNKPAVKGNVSLQTKLHLNETFTLVKLLGTELKTKLEGGVIPGGNVAFSYRGDAITDIKGQTLRLEPFQISAYDLNMTGQVSGEKIIDAPFVSGKITIDAFNPKLLMQSLALAPLKTTDEAALTKLGIIARFTASLDSFSLQSLWAKIDDSTLTGTADLHNFKKPAISYNLKLDKMDIDRYLPPQTASKEGKVPATTQTAQKKTASKVELPLKEIRALDVKGDFLADELIVQKVKLSAVKVKVAAKDGVINLVPRVNVFQGSYDGNLTFDARKDIPATTLKTTAKKINIGRMLKEVANKDMLTGTANLKTDVSFRGIEPEEAKKSLNGTAQFLFQDGQIKGFNIPGMIRKAKATVSLVSGDVMGVLQNLASGDLGALGNSARNRGKEDTYRENEPMDFSEISGSVRIKNGYMVNRDLRMKSPLLRVTGEGASSLVTQGIDYLVKATIVGSLEGQGGKDDLTGLTIPVKIKGTYEKPEWKVDTAPIQQLLQRKLSGKKNNSGTTNQQPAQKRSPADALPKDMQQILKKSPLGNIFR